MKMDVTISILTNTRFTAIIKKAEAFYSAFVTSWKVIGVGSYSEIDGYDLVLELDNGREIRIELERIEEKNTSELYPEKDFLKLEEDKKVK